MRFCFVSTRRGSYFMTELLSTISAATAAAGHHVELVFDEFPPLRDECVYVVIPHEFNAWGNPRGFPDPRQRARTIALCTENPGTTWFEETYSAVSQFAAAVSINRSSTAELRRRGVRCEHLQLGYSPLWDSWLGDERVQRSIDVLYLGAADPRRDPLLGGLGRDLSSRHCQFLIPPLEPRTRPRPDFLTGTEKYDRLRSAQTLLNLHRTTSSALEWMRFLEAICNGCVVVSEPCTDSCPLVPGEHYVATSVDTIALAVNSLLDDPDRLRLMRAQAYEFVRVAMPMGPAAKLLAEIAAALPRQPPTARGPALPADRQTSPPAASRPKAATPTTKPPPSDEARSAPTSPPLSGNRHALSVMTREPRPFRSICNRVLRARGGVQILDQTPAYARTKPRLTVVAVTTRKREREAVEALASIAASACDELELLVADDPPGKQSSPAVKSFLDHHPMLPAAYLHHPVNRGLAHSRNVLTKHARGEYVFVLDPTGGVFPSTLQRLTAALDADPRAMFAYPMIAVFDGRRPAELRSSLPWEPERLKSGNWIDAMALIRRKGLVELGCYSTDPRLAGWEEFDLWCKCAQAGGYGVHVPQVLAWHRRTANSGAVDSEISLASKWVFMRERYPQLLTEPSTGPPSHLACA